LLSQFIAKLLINLSKTHFEPLYYALNVYTHVPASAVPASALLEVLHADRPAVAADAALFVTGILRAATTRFESWLEVLDCVSIARRNGDVELAFNCLHIALKDSTAPDSGVDDLFAEASGPILRELAVAVGSGSDDRVWLACERLYELVKSHAFKLSVVLLPQTSKQLAAKRGFEISIPGRYGVRLGSIAPALEVITTQQRPRILFMVSTTGVSYKFLLKGAGDLRNDERLMQFFKLANAVFKSDEGTQGHAMVIVRYAVVPLSPSSGLISWVDGADTFHQMIFEMREPDGVDEQAVLSEETDCNFESLNALQKYEIFERVAEVWPADELFRFIWIRAPSSSVWLRRTERFTISSALMSMIGYLIGLGDRHPSNIMVQRETGNVVHIDFGEVFESNLRRRQ
jgi:hypothetical protein